MKRFLISGLVLGTVASGMAQTYYITGDYINPLGGVQSGSDWIEPGLAGTSAFSFNSSTGRYEVTLTGLVPGTNYEFKAFNGAGWGGGFGNNSRVRAFSSTLTVTLTPDASTIGDGWEPATGHRIGFVSEPGRQFEVMGSFNGWSTPIALTDMGNGLFESADIPGLMAPNTLYNYKFREVNGGGWGSTEISNNFGQPGDIDFTTNSSWTTTKFRLDTNNGRYAVVPEPASMAVLGLGLAGLVARRKRK